MELVKIEQDSADKRKNSIDLNVEGSELAISIRKLMRRDEGDASSVIPAEERLKVYQTVKCYADKLEGV